MSLPVPGLAALPTRDAVRAALLADAALMDMVKGVLDWVPEKQAYPYIHVGESTETPANAHDRHGSEVLQTLHIWSQYRGYAEALTIATRVLQALDHRPLTILGHRWTWTRFVSLQTLTDPEPPGNIRHVPMDFRIGSEVDST
ncbi:hypothetical protein SSP24_06080 [Streptomyces spinoverrucosus]|uniref:DUF3168 domain-containing protein n=1 Tax=Streptomyces spinoverrucosus TaxID=284043 RepID=A0A4Y3V9E1_9ACTN|nr:DUF3168 domain-containing protein [Streptomyces spinoverrucosus]GEC02953.1 hypothetical protein SSP24_06080 [Streptomyces spinoverrucosus]GHB39328.1 hypothetical protein GCM10010397_06510 [Streptomyces spinoverrucosus]